MSLDPDDRVFAPGDERPVVCQWFARCANPANGLRDHPVLVSVPICKRCDDKVERMSA